MIGSRILVTLAALAMLVQSALAHHSTAMFDSENPIELSGTVKEWQFTNPAGGMLWEFTGAAGGHSLEIRQSGGNPGADMHLLHIEASDTDPDD